MGWYHLAKTIFLKKYPKMLDLLLVAVKPEYQNKGVNALLFSDLIPRLISNLVSSMPRVIRSWS